MGVGVVLSVEVIMDEGLIRLKQMSIIAF